MIEPSATPDVPRVKRHTKLKRRLLKMTAGIVALYLAAMAAFAYAMRLSPETFSRVMMRVGPIPFLLFPFESMWKNARQGHVHVGDAAPDFTLPLLDHSSQVTLSSFRRTKPVWSLVAILDRPFAGRFPRSTSCTPDTRTRSPSMWSI
jgi:hypothetical protein